MGSYASTTAKEGSPWSGPEEAEAQAPAAAPGIGWPRALLSWVLGAGALLMLVAAAGLGYRHATSSPTPVAVDLAALEGGAPLPDPHVEIGKHLALEHWAVLRVPEGAPDGPAAPVSGAWYPLVSGKHPFVQKLREERLSREDLLTVPRARRSELGPVAFLSEARTFATRGDRPARGRLRDQVRGVTYRRASQLARADRALLRETFPGVDLERARVLREGRPPPGLDAVLVSLAVGLALGYLTRRARVAG